MNRRSRIIFMVIVLCAVAGGGFLLQQGGGGKEELPPGETAGLPQAASAPAAVPEQPQAGAGGSGVVIDCEVPETPDRVETVSWQVRDVTADQGYLEELLADNPGQKAYRLKPRGGNDFHQSVKYPYFYLPYPSRDGFQLRKNTEDGIRRDSKFTRKQVQEKVARFLEHFSLEAEPADQWRVEKDAAFDGVGDGGKNCHSERNFRFRVWQAYKGVPVLDTGGYVYDLENAGTEPVSFSEWEFCYGDIGWEEIYLDSCLAMEGTGQYVDVMPLDRAAGFLAEKAGGYVVGEARLGYWFGKGHTLRPYWYLGDGTEYSHFYLVDAGTGEVYGKNNRDNELTVR